MRVQFFGLLLDLPAGWGDVTDDLPSETPPTLVRCDGVGALQFSIGRYHSGKHPHVSLSDLQQLLLGFCEHKQRKFGAPIMNDGAIESVGCTSYDNGETLSVWYLSNGRDIVLATYIAIGVGDPEIAKELAEATRIIGSIDF
jgi:hypothetical protein